MSFPCAKCGEPLVNSRTRDMVYEMTGRFSTMAYLFPRVVCPKCGRDLPEAEWPAELRWRIRSFRGKYIGFGIGLLVVFAYLYFAKDVAFWWAHRK